jgi:ornithine cyclodeaminase/alanine dehydrogenase-like protein (mu-crystallin family)
LGHGQEAETAVYQRTKLIVDDWEQVKLKVDIKALLASGAITQSDVVADLAGVVSGKQPGRVSNVDRIFMRSQGLVPQDITIAYAIYQLAVAQGIGQQLYA